MQLLFEEFGKWLNASANATMMDRDETFTTIFDESQAIMNRPGTALKGLGKASSLEESSIVLHNHTVGRHRSRTLS